MGRSEERLWDLHHLLAYSYQEIKEGLTFKLIIILILVVRYENA